MNACFPFKLKSCPIDMKPVLQSTKNNNNDKNTEIKMEKKKANDWMCVNHRKSQLMIEKKP